MSEQQETAKRLFFSAMMLIPDLLPNKLTRAGIDDLYLQLGADKAWLEKGGPRLWEGDNNIESGNGWRGSINTVQT